jgi:hypothetical protein
MVAVVAVRGLLVRQVRAVLVRQIQFLALLLHTLAVGVAVQLVQGKVLVVQEEVGRVAQAQEQQEQQTQVAAAVVVAMSLVVQQVVREL